ncbi:hypothetical protein BK704_35085 [[Bacillus thuringiensis] serovar konkukian]|nr:hypothetical protein [Bacillus thuringiensis]MED1305102.1 hypothetical protein [Bacillus pacificus]OUA91450.1 hypothetical protein BK704_35085 [[Bacillus thuringiensis] serovar konkukian]
MRHTRNRQLAKLHNEPMWFWSKEGTDDIRSQRHWMKMGLEPKLDPTFKWHRESDYGDNWIELGGDGYRYGVLLQAKSCYKTLKGLTK